MSHSIDPSFRLNKLAARRSRRRASLRKAGMLVLAASAAAGAWLWLARPDMFDRFDVDQELTAREDAAALPPDAAVFVPAIVDLAGDPMWIASAAGADRTVRAREVPRPEALASAVPSPELSLLDETMLSGSERFITAIPSAQEDFAFFQTRQASLSAWPTSIEPAFPEDLPQEPESFGDDDLAAGWGETVTAGEAPLPAFHRTEIENNISVATAIPEADRRPSTEDAFVKILVSRSLANVLGEGGVTMAEAEKADEAWRRLFAGSDLTPGSVVAFRRQLGHGPASGGHLVQVSVYDHESFLGTLTRDATGTFVAGADPWVRDDLIHYGARPADDAVKRQYRLLDAIYSTAARNGVPTAVIGEAIMYLSRAHDLDVFATDTDRLTLVYGEAGRDAEQTAGRVLYVGIHGSERPIQCFVFKQGDGQFACVSENDRVRSLQIANGMVTPVSGVLTSTFGPRRHPILKTVRIHKGVDWAAPVGTPIAAAFDGEIVFQGDGGGYGNVVRIAHEGGRETRYAHMQRFALENAVGARVKAGDVIGFVGTTGLSTGPHLHFELYLNDQAVDPLGATLVVAESDATAVDTLTDQIIKVESAGNARAKNPLSTATGLGQFIESTWIRMMNTYRPDLAGSLSRAELLALRFDPTISREMVRNLAREGEAYLRARGHAITAGRLYLCHFLGMEGAHTVLSASPGASLVDVLGSGVINANPFLRGRDVNYVIGWAEAKMRRRGRGSSAPAPVLETREVRDTSPEFEAYKTALTGLLSEAARGGQPPI